MKNDRYIPKDPMAEWFDRAKNAEEKIERMQPIVNAAIDVVRMSGRYNTQVAYERLQELVREYKP